LPGEKLTELWISYNNLTNDLTPLRKFVNLKELHLRNNNFFGSLEPLSGMVKLKELRIDDTNLDRGLEYLPTSVRKFHCLAEKILNVKGKKLNVRCQAILDLLADEQGKVEAKKNGGLIENFPQKLQEYKQ